MDERIRDENLLVVAAVEGYPRRHHVSSLETIHTQQAIDQLTLTGREDV
jgi:hypothetical protein